MSNTTEIKSHGIGFFGLLAILFIGLKLGGIIKWSWWWVTIPLWGGLAFVSALAIGGALGIIFAYLIKAAWLAWKNRN